MQSWIGTQSHRIRLVPVNIRWYSIAEQILLPWIFYRYRLSLLHVPHINIPWLYFGKLVITVHDLTKWEYGAGAAKKGGGGWFNVLNIFFRMTFVLAVARANRIIVPSYFSAGKLIQYFPKAKQKIEVIPEACDGDFRTSAKPSERSAPPYILYVGALYPYKNVFRVIQALAKLSSPVCLAIATFQDDLAQALIQKVKSEGYSVCVRLHLKPSDAELRNLYAGAHALIHPSLSEGFGLPCLEAMGMGTPVLAARAGSLPEVCGDAALYFDPSSSDDIARAIQGIMENPAVSKSLIEKGAIRAQQFSWENAAEKTHRVYEEILRGTPRS